MNIYISPLFAAAIAFLAGYLAKTYNITPKRIFSHIYRKIKKPEKTYGPWSIGIFTGKSPFKLKSPDGVSNPVITGADVSDFDASFVADPFIVKKSGKFYMFFEALQRKTQKGVISYAISDDGIDWQYQKTIIEEPFHLSYPYIFEWENDFYLIPESNEDYSIRLYRAKRFPHEWEHIHTLLFGFDFTDPSIFRFNNKWWMFVSTSRGDFVNLYFSDRLENGWTAHPQNPIVRDDRHISRPGGRVLKYNEKLYRIAQDTYPVYGSRLFAFKIEKITENEYAEKPIEENPILEKHQSGWNSKGMHHLDTIYSGENWIAAVDGRWT